MMYKLEELLTKMGAPEVKEKGQIRWHYFDRQHDEVGGFAEVRLLDGGAALVAEMKHLHYPAAGEQDENSPGLYNETLYLHARRNGARYEVTKIAFDGEEYAQPQKPVIELGLSLFHARALDISILMVEQAFNKQDIVQPVIDHSPQFRGVPAHVKPSVKKDSWGVVVPFRPRVSSAGMSL